MYKKNNIILLLIIIIDQFRTKTESKEYKSNKDGIIYSDIMLPDTIFIHKNHKNKHSNRICIHIILSNKRR